MKGYKNSTKTVYETEESANYGKGGMAKVGKVMGEFKRGTLHSGSKKGPEVTNPKQAIAIAMSEARKAGAKLPMKKAEGGSVKKPRPYDPVKDEPTSRPLTADQVRNLRNRMKASKPPAKRAYDPVLDEPTSRPFAKGGKVMRKAEGGPVAPEFNPGPAPAARPAALDPAREAAGEAARQDMMRMYRDRENAALDARQAAQERRGVRGPVMLKAKGGSVKAAVHKHERAMHPGKPLTALKKGGVVEKGSGEVYASKAAMRKHEAKESAAMERAEHGKRKGGKVGC